MLEALTIILTKTQPSSIWIIQTTEIYFANGCFH